MICPNCKKEYEPVLGERKTNLLIQQEFPNAEVWQREQLITGICSQECWNKYIGYTIVHSSNGEIAIDPKGFIKSVKMEKGGSLPEIIQFDLVEYENFYGKKELEYDILDLGFWYIQDSVTKYCKADPDFRKRQRKGGD